MFSKRNSVMQAYGVMLRTHDVASLMRKKAAMITIEQWVRQERPNMASLITLVGVTGLFNSLQLSSVELLFKTLWRRIGHPSFDHRGRARRFLHPKTETAFHLHQAPPKQG